MSHPKPLKHRELLKFLKPFNIIEVKKRGKGSEAKFCHKDSLLNNGIIKGAFITIKNHGEGTEHSIKVIQAVLRRFNVDEKIFWNQ